MLRGDVITSFHKSKCFPICVCVRVRAICCNCGFSETLKSETFHYSVITISSQPLAQTCIIIKKRKYFPKLKRNIQKQRNKNGRQDDMALKVEPFEGLYHRETLCSFTIWISFMVTYISAKWLDTKIVSLEKQTVSRLPKGSWQQLINYTNIILDGVHSVGYISYSQDFGVGL